MKNILNPPLPTEKDTRVSWGELSGDSKSLALSLLAEKTQEPILIITPDVHSVNTLYAALKFFSKEPGYPIFRFPDWETLPYDHFSPHQDIISERSWRNGALGLFEFNAKMISLRCADMTDLFWLTVSCFCIERQW